jgi:hypothetical protein
MRMRRLGLMTVLMLVVMGVSAFAGCGASSGGTSASGSDYVSVSVMLLDVVSHDTESVDGPDKLYIIGSGVGKAIKDTSKPTTQTTLTTPIEINDKDLRTFPVSERTLFSDRVVLNTDVTIAASAFDRDFAATWEGSDTKTWLDKIVPLAAAAAAKSGNPYVAGAGAAVAAGYAGFSALASADKDDHLGDFATPIKPIGPPTEILTWHFAESQDFIGYSSWDYDVRVLVTRTGQPIKQWGPFSRISATGSMHLVDDDTPFDPQVSDPDPTFASEPMTMGPGSLPGFMKAQGCEDEVRVDLAADAMLGTDKVLTVVATASFFEGTECSDGDEQETKTVTFTVPLGGTATQTIELKTKEKYPGTAKITLTVTNTFIDM